MKSILVDFKSSKTVILTILEPLNAVEKCKNSLKPNFRGADKLKIAGFKTPDSQKLISRKILVVGKLPNFHTVYLVIG